MKYTFVAEMSDKKRANETTSFDFFRFLLDHFDRLFRSGEE